MYRYQHEWRNIKSQIHLQFRNIFDHSSPPQGLLVPFRFYRVLTRHMKVSKMSNVPFIHHIQWRWSSRSSDRDSFFCLSSLFSPQASQSELASHTQCVHNSNGNTVWCCDVPCIIQHNPFCLQTDKHRTIMETPKQTVKMPGINCLIKTQK